MSIFLLLFSVLLALAVATTFVPIRRDPVTGASFVTGWITGELAGQFLGIDVAIVALCLWLGAAHHTTGKIALVINAAAVLGLLILIVLGRLARGVVRRSLDEIPGMQISLNRLWTAPRWGRWWRVVAAIPTPGRRLEVIKNIDYVGDGTSAHRLDVIRPRGDLSGAPVLLYVHGGAWILGDKREQGKPMMFELASRGWVCVTINYRLSPKATWPDHIVDTKRAIVWVREHIKEYGGDARFLAISGGSAGGHLAALAALSPGDPGFQPGFEDSDTHVDACVPLYGVLEMTADKATSGRYGPGLKLLLERQVMKQSLAEHRDVFEAASPLHRINAEAPPFLVVHGTNDTLVPIAVPRAFVPALRAISRNPVGYFELPLAQHAFDVTASPRTSATTAGIVAFLETVRERARESADAIGEDE